MTAALNRLKTDGLVTTETDIVTGDPIFIASDKARQAFHRG